MDGGLYLYAWQVQDSDGQWSMVGALIPQTGTHQPLIHRNPAIIERLRPIAVDHAVARRQKLRLVRLVVDEVLETRDHSEAKAGAPLASVTCPACGMTSYHPDDVAHRYCGNCHLFHDRIKGPT